jgi:hypothetical protein
MATLARGRDATLAPNHGAISITSKISVPFDQRGALSIPEFCAWSGLGRTFVRAAIRARELRVTKRGRRSLISMDEARRYVRHMAGDAA